MLRFNLRNIYSWRFLTCFKLNIQNFEYKSNGIKINNFKPRTSFKHWPYFLAFFPFFTFKKEDDEEDEKPERLLGKAHNLFLKGDKKEALEILHQILHIISEQFKNGEIIENEYEKKKARIYSEMGAVYIAMEKYEEAEKLLKETIRSCLLAGVEMENETVLELCLKLALIYAKAGRIEEAESGFTFCINSADKVLTKGDLDDERKENYIGLSGMSYNYYSKLLYINGQSKKGLFMAEKAIVQAKKIYHSTHPNIINILNDIGVLNISIGDLKTADAKFEEAINLCLKSPREELMTILSVIYANYSQLFLRYKDDTKAEEMCINSKKYWKIPESVEGENDKIDKEILVSNHVDDCFMRLAGFRSSKRED